MEPVLGRVERYLPDQLVVDLGDLELVRKELDQLGVTAEYIDKDDRLDFARLALPNLPQELPRIQPNVEVERRIDRERAARGVEPSELDRLLIILRVRFTGRYDGWTPTMGKNRSVELARGFPHLGGGIAGSGSGDPEAVAEPAEFELDGSGQQAGRGIRVAILDTEVLVHPFLLGKSIAPLSASLPGAPPFAMAGHGTFVAGLILRRAPGADLEVHPVLNERAVGDTWAAARKLAEVAESGVRIINLSWGCYTDDGQAPLVLARAVERLGPDVLVVAAAGNHGDILNAELVVFPEDEKLTLRTPSWPAAFDRVIAVGASGDDRALARFTPKGPWVDVVAPGVDVVSTYVTGDVFSEHLQKREGVVQLVQEPLRGFKGFAKWSGTSFATATVSGQLAAKAVPGGADSIRQALYGLSNLPVSAQAGDAGIRLFTLDDLG
jgi:membrane-anchored mycosin MYCP